MQIWENALEKKSWHTPVGEIRLTEDRCKGCNFCIKFCPKNVLEESKKFNIKGYHPPEVKAPDACIGCGYCELLCPEMAIFVIKKSDKK